MTSDIDQTALDAACLTAHGGADGDVTTRQLVAIFGGGVAHELLLMGARLGYGIALVEPDSDARETAVTRIPGLTVAAAVNDLAVDDTTDIVMTDHHRDELGPLLKEALATNARWIGLMGNARHEGPHIEALRGLGVGDDEIARVHRPIGLNIGSRTPPEIAISTLAGLVANRADRPGGFTF